MSERITVKKYSNRRLYDTSQSKYVTLDELAATIRGGAQIEVVDAKSGEDLTQGVLAQILIESRGAAKLWPDGMLTQLIRMEDEALAEFFGQYMSWGLSVYLRARQQASQLGPFGGEPGPGQPGYGAPNTFTQWMGGMYSWPGFQGGGVPAPPPTQPPAAASKEHAHGATGDQGRDEVSAMREELDELKSLLKQVALAQADKT